LSNPAALSSVVLIFIVSFSSSVTAVPDFAGVWMLNGPGSESEILLKEQELHKARIKSADRWSKPFLRSCKSRACLGKSKLRD